MLSILIKPIEKLELSNNIIKILKENEVETVNDIWIKKRPDLKEIKLTDKEINEIEIKLQLKGIDLNKKIY